MHVSTHQPPRIRSWLDSRIKAAAAMYMCVCGVCVCVNGRRLIHYQRPFCQACESIFFLPLFFPPFSLSLLDCSMSSLIETTNKEEVPVSAVQPISGMIVRALLLFRSC